MIGSSSLWRGDIQMAIELLCRKIGMTRIFDDSGEAIPVTVLEAGPNVVVQKKTNETDGYTALQLGFGDRRESLFTKPEKGHFEKAGVAPKRHLRESRLEPDEIDAHEVGSEIDVGIFEEGQYVDAVGTSKGRGFAGVVKRHGMAIKKRTHGTHEAFRHGGSIGAGAWPAKVIKGMKMPGQLGNEQVTVRNLQVVKVEPEKNLLFVRGSVPGHRDAIVAIRKAVLSVKG
jgi:large subunit ribosomal protein L3